MALDTLHQAPPAKTNFHVQNLQDLLIKFLTCVADFKNLHAIISASFERDQALNLSGVAVNNSRQVEVSATLQSLPVNHQIVVFLEYSAVAKAFIDNTSISV